MSILSFELVCLVEAGKTRFTTSFISLHFEGALPLLITPLFIFLLFSIRGNTVLCVTLFSSPSCNAILNLQLGPIFFFASVASPLLTCSWAQSFLYPVASLPTTYNWAQRFFCMTIWPERSKPSRRGKTLDHACTPPLLAIHYIEQLLFFRMVNLPATNMIWNNIFAKG